MLREQGTLDRRDRDYIKLQGLSKEDDQETGRGKGGIGTVDDSGQIWAQDS